MNKNILILGPKCSGKTTFIYTYLNNNKTPCITIGADIYNCDDLYLWDTGSGLYYKDIINSLIKKINIIIIINNNKNTNFIYDVLNYIQKNDNIKHIIIVSNNVPNFKYKENIIQNLNTEIIFSFFYINCKIKTEVDNVIEYINKI